jgi:hypothetical protein
VEFVCVFWCFKRRKGNPISFLKGRFWEERRKSKWVIFEFAKGRRRLEEKEKKEGLGVCYNS